jgi:tetratricopeptide (TPR) repeat protein
MKIVINGLCTVLFIAIVGCVSGGRSHMQSSPADEETTQQLEQALEDLANENYTSAAHILEQLIKEKPVSEFDLVILYNSAVAREGLKNCEVAAERYRSVARIANKRFDRVAALALYRLGFAYDCLGDSQKSVVAFLDARKASKSLPPDVATAELPARLAAGYASLGRQKEALHYFDEASGGLKRLLSRAKGGSADKKLAASTMYAMGRLSETNDPVTFARMLSMQQPFLLQSAELAAGPSSSRAKSDLKEAYHRLIQQKLKDPKQ